MFSLQDVVGNVSEFTADSFSIANQITTLTVMNDDDHVRGGIFFEVACCIWSCGGETSNEIRGEILVEVNTVPADLINVIDNCATDSSITNMHLLNFSNFY